MYLYKLHFTKWNLYLIHFPLKRKIIPMRSCIFFSDDVFNIQSIDQSTAQYTWLNCRMEISHFISCSRADSDSSGGDGGGVLVTVVDSFTLLTAKKIRQTTHNEWTINDRWKKWFLIFIKISNTFIIIQLIISRYVMWKKWLWYTFHFVHVYRVTANYY